VERYIVSGYSWVIDFDLEKCFDRVNHDKLVGQITKRVEDKRLLKLIRAFLNAGVMEDGLVSPSVGGALQGGPLSPLLSNLVLDELDRELSAGDTALFVMRMTITSMFAASAGQRVMESITHFITQKLKLKVNESKSRWPDRRSGSSSGSALRLLQKSSASSRQKPWSGLSNESVKSGARLRV
jgi:RNA-directed DNA polymerase